MYRIVAVIISLTILSLGISCANPDDANELQRWNSVTPWEHWNLNAYRCSSETTVKFLESSRLTMTLRSQSGLVDDEETIEIPLKGRVFICDLPCDRHSCLIRFKGLTLQSHDDWSQTIGGRDVREFFAIASPIFHPGAMFLGKADWDSEIIIPEGTVRIRTNLKLDGEVIITDILLDEFMVAPDWDTNSIVTEIEVDDAEKSVVVSLVGEVTNRPPVPDAGGNKRVECDGLLTSVDFDGTNSYDFDGDQLYYRWINNELGISETGPAKALKFPQGEHIVYLELNDGNSRTYDRSIVSVVDSTPPRAISTPLCAFVSEEARGKMVSLDEEGLHGLFEDKCDPQPVVEVEEFLRKIVEKEDNGREEMMVNQHAVDSGEPFKLPTNPGEQLTMRLRASDSSGNVTRQDLTVGFGEYLEECPNIEDLNLLHPFPRQQ